MSIIAGIAASASSTGVTAIRAASGDFRLPIGDAVSDGIDFITAAFRPVFDVIRAIFGGMYDGLDVVLSSPPFWAIIIVIAALGYFARGWLFALGSAVGRDLP